MAEQQESVLAASMREALQVIHEIDDAANQFAAMQKVVAKLHAGGDDAFDGVQMSISIPESGHSFTFAADASMMEGVKADPAWAATVKASVMASLNAQGMAVMDGWAKLHTITQVAKNHCDLQRAQFDAAQAG